MLLISFMKFEPLLGPFLTIGSWFEQVWILRAIQLWFLNDHFFLISNYQPFERILPLILITVKAYFPRMLCAKLSWIGLVVLENKIFNQTLFLFFLNYISLNGTWPLFRINVKDLPNTMFYVVPSLVRIDPVVLDNNF